MKTSHFTTRQITPLRLMKPCRGVVLEERGFSLIELMVAMTISLILVTIASSIYLTSRQTYRTTDEVAYLQEQGRFALDLLGKDIRLAGFTHAFEVGAARIRSSIPIPITGCESGFAATSPPSSNASYPVVITCNPAISATVSDALFVQYEAGDPDQTGGAGERYVSDISLGNGSNCLGNNPMYVTYPMGYPDPAAGQPTILAAVANPSAIPPAGVAAGARAIVQNYYFIGTQTQVVDGVTQTFGQLMCTGIGQNGSVTTQPLVQGVQEMHLTYGVDTNGDQVADTFVVGSSVADWTQVLSVNVCLLMQTQAANVALSQQPYTDCNGVTQTPAATDRFIRRAFRSTFNLRNRVSEGLS